MLYDYLIPVYIVAIPPDTMGVPVRATACVAKSFHGRATAELSKKKTSALRIAAAKANVKLSDETRICRFDPPFKPGFLHYNEIVIPISKTD